MQTDFLSASWKTSLCRALRSRILQRSSAKSQTISIILDSIMLKSDGAFGPEAAIKLYIKYYFPASLCRNPDSFSNASFRIPQISPFGLI